MAKPKAKPLTPQSALRLDKLLVKLGVSTKGTPGAKVKPKAVNRG